MSDISKINSTGNLNSSYGVNSKNSKQGNASQSQAQAGNQSTTQTQNTSSKSPDEVMNFLAASYRPISAASANTTKKTLNVNDYVTPEQAARIGASANNCMSVLFTAEKQGKDMGLSDSSSQKLAVQTANSLMPQ